MSRSVIDKLTDERTDEILSSEMGQGVQEMLLSRWPWQTFGTITTVTPAGPEQMKKMIFKTMKRRPLKGVQFFWCLEPFKERSGFHAHFLSKNEPSDHRWDKTWDWYHNKRRYGRFQTRPIRGQNRDLFKVAAYLTKYCTKSLSNAQWGFEGFGRTRMREINHDKGPRRSGSSVRSKRRLSLEAESAAWAASRWNTPKIIRRKQGKIWLGVVPSKDEDSPEMIAQLKKFHAK